MSNFWERDSFTCSQRVRDKVWRDGRPWNEILHPTRPGSCLLKVWERFAKHFDSFLWAWSNLLVSHEYTFQDNHNLEVKKRPALLCLPLLLRGPAGCILPRFFVTDFLVTGDGTYHCKWLLPLWPTHTLEECRGVRVVFRVLLDSARILALWRSFKLWGSRTKWCIHCFTRTHTHTHTHTLFHTHASHTVGIFNRRYFFSLRFVECSQNDELNYQVPN